MKLPGTARKVALPVTDVSKSVPPSISESEPVMAARAARCTGKKNGFRN